MPMIVPTSAQLIINEWLGLREVLSQITTPIQDKQNDVPHLLSETQISDGFHGPFHPMISQIFSLYATIGKMKVRQIIIQDDNIKPHIRELNTNLSDDINLDLNVAALDKTLKQLDSLAKKQLQEWQENIDHWQQQLVMQLTFGGINLSELEIKELSQLDPLYVLVNRFTHLHLELPKTNSEHYTFAEYFKLKAILCVHSALSRQFKPHGMPEIEKILKNIKTEFDDIEEKAAELIETQEQATQELMQTLRY